MIEYQNGFRNGLQSDPRAFRQSLIRQTTIQHDQPEQTTRRSPSRYVIWPLLFICGPVTILATVLLIIVFTNRIKPEGSLLVPDQNDNDYRSDVLVNFSATRIVFLASFLSTVAPMLSSVVMSLYALVASQRLRAASQGADSSSLPTPYQMGLLVGLLLATLDQLKRYISHFFSRRRTSGIPPVVNRSAVVLILTLVLAWSVILADSVLHYVTTTIDFDQVVAEPASQELGRGLSSTCLNFNRTALFGWPCSVAIGWDDPNFTEEQNEAVRLAHNDSNISEVRLAPMDGEQDTQLAYLVPDLSQMNSTTDYRATTVGISSQCRLIPPSTCNFTTWGPDSIYTNFSCSDAFHGTLGKTPNVSEADGTRSPDPYRSTLMYKPAANLMYTFFSDPNQKTIYNTPGYNDSGQLDENTYPLPDSQLVNPFYITFAARTPTSSFQPSSQLLTPNNNLTFPNPSGNQYIDYLLNCAVSSHEVTYTWLSSPPSTLAASTLTHTPTPNGSVLEIFHGAQLYTGIGQLGYDLQDHLIQSAIAGTSPSSFTTTFASLYSTKVLAKIGAYTTPRTVEAQQSRHHLLVARIPTPALAVLVALCFLYPIVGAALGYAAMRALRREPAIEDVARQLSLRGLSATAFGEKSWGEDVDRGEGFVSRLPRSRHRSDSERGTGAKGTAVASEKEESWLREERRVRVSAAPGQGYVFKVWV